MSRQILTGFQHKCPVCGKEFTAQSVWAYQMPDKKQHKTLYLCSWKCKRKKESEKNEN